MATPHIDDSARSFEADHHTYENFAVRLHQLIIDLLSQARLNTIQVEFRAKTVASFKEKIRRKGYGDPMKQMTDLVGLRIVCYYLEDVEQIGEIIASNFHVHEEDSVKKATELDFDKFGYRSDHYVVSLGQARRSLPEWAEFADLRAEIQVRTALQHAWAAVDHKLNYKKVEEIPKGLQRRLIRLSALFELADEEFSAIQNLRKNLLDEHTEDVAAGRFSAKLDDISFIAYLKSVESRIALQLPNIENTAQAPLQYAVNMLRQLGIDTVDDLQRMVGDDWAANNHELVTIDDHLRRSRYPHIITPAVAILTLAMTRLYDRSRQVVPDATEWKALRSAATQLGYN